ncbi:hypothetical protein [Herbihabitans rhizosphaerae]|nr:hypothetical protein [Herbihabitans rhizosphaerae]
MDRSPLPGVAGSSKVDTATLVERGLRRLLYAEIAWHDMPERTREERAVKEDRRAELYAREARWFGILSRVGPYDVYTSAAIRAQCSAERHAETWREFAEQSRSLAARGALRGVA